MFNVFFHEPATTEIYTYLHTPSLHVALPIFWCLPMAKPGRSRRRALTMRQAATAHPMARSFRQCPAASYRSRSRMVKKRSEEHTSELQSLMRSSYAVFCLKTKSKKNQSAAVARTKQRLK